CPSPSSTTPEALRSVSEGIVYVADEPGTAMVTVLLVASSLTLTFKVRLMWPLLSTTGRNFTATPYCLKTMVTVFKFCGTGIGKSPPDKKQDSWPLQLVLVASVRIR